MTERLYQNERATGLIIHVQLQWLRRGSRRGPRVSSREGPAGCADCRLCRYSSFIIVLTVCRSTCNTLGTRERDSRYEHMCRVRVSAVPRLCQVSVERCVRTSEHVHRSGFCALRGVPGSTPPRMLSECGGRAPSPAPRPPAPARPAGGGLEGGRRGRRAGMRRAVARSGRDRRFAERIERRTASVGVRPHARPWPPCPPMPMPMAGSSGVHRPREPWLCRFSL